MTPRAPRSGLRVGMASFGDLAFDSRVQREARSLADAGHRVRLYVLDVDEPDPTLLGADVEVVRHGHSIARSSVGAGPFAALARVLHRLAWMVRYRRALGAWGRWVAADGRELDAWHLHDFPALSSIAPHLRPGVPYVYDSHEIYLAAGAAASLPRPVRAWLGRTEATLGRRARALVTVNDACAAILARLGAPETIVVHNCPPYPDDLPHSDPLRARLDLPASARILLYHGLLGVSRGLEQLMDAMRDERLRDVHLVLLGYGELRDALADRAAAHEAADRIHVLDAVAVEELPSWIRPADVAVMPIQPSTLNLRLSTPNKLFEALSVGVPAVVSDFPAMRAIVQSADGALGRTCDPTDTGSIAEASASILELDPAARLALHARCREAARTRWNWDVQARGLVELYGRIAGEPPSAEAG